MNILRAGFLFGEPAFLKKSFGICVIFFQDAVDENICIEKDRDDNRARDGRLKKRQGMFGADEREYKGGGIHGKEKKGARERKNPFHFFHENHPLHLS